MKYFMKNVVAIILTLMSFILLQTTRSTPLPVLIYHHFDSVAAADTYVTPERFREQLTALKKAGFSAVTLEDVKSYVKYGVPLPKKPVLITMDDGYSSNIDIAAPILEEFDMSATIFMIGIYEGKKIDDVYSGNTIYPERFSYEEAEEWVKKGVLDIQSHSFDMHHLSKTGYSKRDGMLSLDDESIEEYRLALETDYVKFEAKRSNRVDTPLMALAYPYGYYTEELDAILDDVGYDITFTIEEECSEVGVWDDESLRMLGRYNVTDRMSGRELVNKLESALEQ